MLFEIKRSQQILGVELELDLRCVTSGKEACTQLAMVPFDLAFLDIVLPDINGLDVAEWYLKRSNAEHESASARASDIRSPATLIALTSLDMTDAIEEELQRAFSEILIKPMTIMKLRATLQRWLPRAILEGSELSSGTCLPVGATVRILQVEDCDIASTAIEHLFSSVGCWIETVDNGEAAMEKLTTSHLESHPAYDLVLLDMNLPVVSGYALSSWYTDFCQQHGQRRVPVIAVTAEPDAVACKEFGIDRCLPKPVTIEMVRELMGQWLAMQ
uniref:Response regulatory domain-containing protein n=1 Tax=Coccolithus braarudii TaxID=221442 RepID=A0A7S0LCN9_9EUKA